MLLSFEPRGVRTAQDEVLHGHRAVLRAVIPLTHHTHPTFNNAAVKPKAVRDSLSKLFPKIWGASAFFLKSGTLILLV